MRKASAICYGEFDWPDDNAKRSYMRNAFLRAADEYAPEFWRDLYDRSLPVYNELKSESPHLQYRDLYHWVTSLLSHDLTHPFYRQYGKVALLIRFLTAWSQKWNLVESDDSARQWVLNIALVNLESWARSLPLSPGEKPEFFSAVANSGGAMPTVPKPPEGLPEYEPQNIRQKPYLEWVHAKALDTINKDPILRYSKKPTQRALADSVQVVAKAYCRKVDEVYERSGFKRSSGNQKRNLAQHLEWTVRFQIKGEKQGGIAPHVNNDSSVSRAVNGILGLIGLKNRSDGKGGRIPGSKNKPRKRLE